LLLFWDPLRLLVGAVSHSTARSSLAPVTTPARRRLVTTARFGAGLPAVAVVALTRGRGALVIAGAQ
jgi:hypothetical protein